MAQWVKLCGLADAPAAGQVMESEVNGVSICVANVGGEISAVDNICPHRQGPLGQGWLEGDSVVCPWHSWTFHLKTGKGEFPVKDRIAVFPVKVEGEDVLIDLDKASPNGAESSKEHPLDYGKV